MKHLLKSCLSWEIVLCLVGMAACLVPTVPRTGAFWGISRTWTSLDPGRIHIDEVFPGSPAAAAGLKPGDWVTAVNGRRVEGVEVLDQTLDQMTPGSVVELRGERPGQQLDWRAVGWEPQVEALAYYDAQLVCLVVCGALALFLIAVQPLRPTPLWRPLTVLLVGFVGAVLLVLSQAHPFTGGWFFFSWVRLHQRWLIDKNPDWPRLAIQGVCLAVALGLALLGALEIRGLLKRRGLKQAAFGLPDSTALAEEAERSGDRSEHITSQQPPTTT